jgi:hypothetical protein
MSTKAQIFSTDFIVASSIFILLSAIVYSLWLSRAYSIEESNELGNLIDSAYMSSNVWLREGVPKYWNEENIIDLGLQNNHRLNRTKLEMLNKLGYERVKDLAGLRDYDFFMRIYNKNNQTLFEFGKMSEAKNIVKVKRISMLDSEIVLIDTIVWSR